MERDKRFYRLSLLIIISILVLASIIILATNHVGVQFFLIFSYIIAILLFLFVILMLFGFFGVRNILSNNESDDETSQQKLANASKLNYSKPNFVTRIALRYFMPLMLSISDLFNYYKDDVRHIYIKANNQYVLSGRKKFLKDKILILLPHCLQNSECSQRIRNGLDECIQCSNCNIGDIKEIIKQYGVVAEIATGGTSARKVIKDTKPEFVIAVACERDLTSGLLDVKGIPVYGILNNRPNGPCKNTFVDINELKKTIEHFYQ